MPECTNLLELRVHNCTLENADAVSICQAAVRCTKIEVINMNYNSGISPNGIRQIASICFGIPNLTPLFFNNSNSGIAGATAVIQMIPQFPSLAYLWLKSCKIPAQLKDEMQATWIAVEKESSFLDLGEDPA